MNLYGSYRKLLEHSKQAMIAAIEIYNKPKFDYREEVCSMLMTNAWELIVLAILSKNKQTIFEPKVRNQSRRTLRFENSIKKAKFFFPENVSDDAVFDNIELIREYRNTAIHYYHDPRNKHAIYALAHASIRNYRDLLLEMFSQDIADEISIVLLPLSFNGTPNFVEFFRTQKVEKLPPFVKVLFKSLQRLESVESSDTSRLITQCTIKFEHAKNILSADIIAGGNGNGETHLVSKKINPDDSHPFFQSDIIGDRKDKPKHSKLRFNINSYYFQALAWKHGFKDDPEYCWISKKGGSPRYSQKVIDFINRLTEEDIDTAKREYGIHLKSPKRSKKK